MSHQSKVPTTSGELDNVSPLGNLGVNILTPKITELLVPIVGTSRLVSHAWDQKAINMMLDKQKGKAVPKKAPKDPEADFKASLYQSTEGWYGFPAVAFKQAAVAACRFCDNSVKMNIARGIIFVQPDGYTENGHDIVRIDGDEPVMRQDMVRIGMGTADIRYRGEFRNWSANLRVRVNANILSPEHIFNLFELAGHHVGIGEGRPGAPKTSMDWGMFRTNLEVQAIADLPVEKAA